MKSSLVLLCFAALAATTLAHQVQSQPIVDETKFISWFVDQIRFAFWIIGLSLIVNPIGWIATFFFGRPQLYQTMFENLIHGFLRFSSER